MSNATAFWLCIDGIPATEIAAHTPPTWETLADGGIGEVTWAFALTARSQHQALRKGVKVEVMCGAMPVATAEMTEPDRSTWECHAFGMASSLRKKLALDSLGAVTRDLDVAITQAIARGWRGANPLPVTGTVAGTSEANSPIPVATLLDQYAEQTGQRWGVDAQGWLYMRPDPTSAKWSVTPDAAAFGVTDEDMADTLFGRFNDGGFFATAQAGEPGAEEAIDLSDRGSMTLVAAEAILAGMLQRSGETKWVNGVTLHREQLTTRGGTPAFLASVTAGQMVRAHGLASNVISNAPWLDVVIGKTRYTAGDDVIYIEPTNTAPRTAVDVWAA